MNKLTIPAILVATVMVAGMFAFMPIEQASTVHTTLTGASIVSVDSTTAGFDPDAASTLTIASSADYHILSVQCNINDGGANDTDFSFTATVGGATIQSAIVDPAAGDQVFELTGLIAGDGGDDTIITVVVDTAGSADDETIDCVVVVQTSSASTVTAIWA